MLALTAAECQRQDLYRKGAGRQSARCQEKQRGRGTIRTTETGAGQQQSRMEFGSWPFSTTPGRLSVDKSGAVLLISPWR